MSTTLKIAALATMKVSDKSLPIKLQASNNMFLLDIDDKSSALSLKPKEIIESFIHSDDKNSNQGIKDILDALPDINIELDRLLLAIIKPSLTESNATAVVLNVAIGSDINLSDLPLVGTAFPKGYGVEGFKVMFSSDNFKTEHINVAKELKLKTVTKGLTLGSQLNLGGESTPVGITIDMPSSKKKDKKKKKTKTVKPNNIPHTNTPKTKSKETQALVEKKPASSSTTHSNSKDGQVKWITLNKKLGPVFISKIGMEMKKKNNDTKLFLHLTASLSISVIKFSLEGLSAGSSIKEFSPEFNLQGLSLEYQKGGVYIGGALLRQQLITEKGEAYDDYSGAAIVKLPSLSLGAMGSYANLNGNPSLFVYAFVDGLLLGPAFFVVSGLALGFGYNRSLVVPPIEELESFPLISKIMGSGEETTLLEDLKKLQKCVPVTIDQYFLAVGVKFTAFRMIEGFVLVTIAFGQRFELYILGLARLSCPVSSGIDPIAQIEIAVKASFLPDKGFLGVEGVLTSSSYILSKDCHLTGGFAFYSWFSGEHEGDFVLTAGGYHPNFKAPAHYPQNVPRIGLSWQPDNYLNVKGSLYFALCPHLLMAGGKLEASWKKGSIDASFMLSADFLVAWQPFYYSAYLAANIHVNTTIGKGWFSKNISLDVNTNVSLWGPDFGGKAHIDLSVISFTIPFGEAKKSQPAPIEWPAFKKAFLPDDKLICAISVKSGLLGNNSATNKQENKHSDNLGIINPKELCLISTSAIPIKTVKINGLTIASEKESNTNFGISSMAVSEKQLSTSLSIAIQRDNADVTDEFSFIPITKNVPIGAWGTSSAKDINADTHIKDTLAGFEIMPKDPIDVTGNQTFDLENFKYDLSLSSLIDKTEFDNMLLTSTMPWENSAVEKHFKTKPLSITDEQLWSIENVIESVLMGTKEHREQLINEWSTQNTLDTIKPASDIDLAGISKSLLAKPIMSQSQNW